MTMRIKICGVTRVDDAIAAIEAGADLIGINFYAPSPRSIDLERALEIRAAIGRRAFLVGVFVNAARASIEQRRVALELDMLQFHGDEDDDALSGWPVPVIRALRVRAGDAAQAIARARADFALLDSFHPSLYGGTGVARPLEELSGLDLSRVIISGGLNPENAQAAAALSPFALDCASGVESAPGAKDHSKLRSFIANARIS
ncbi:MAG TPA: phosphoribosylanthranilate isomerase [Candidatus Binataceae bacterium]|nr:phosphoribosylanthranilate isomerase [Candidatus Binataceae bacterium]